MPERDPVAARIVRYDVRRWRWGRALSLTSMVLLATANATRTAWLLSVIIPLVLVGVLFSAVRRLGQRTVTVADGGLDLGGEPIPRPRVTSWTRVQGRF